MTSSEANFLCCTVCQTKWSYSKNGSVWQTHSMYNAYFIQHSLYLHNHPPFVSSNCPSYYYSVAFQGRCAQVLQIYGNRKLTDHLFSGDNMTHPSPSFRVHTTSKYSDKSTLQEAMFLFWDEDIAFLRHTKWSTKHSGSNQRGTAKDTRSQVLEAANLSFPVPPSLSARRSWCTSTVHPVLTSSVYYFFVFVFIQILIDLYPLSKCATWLIHVHPTWSEENILVVLHIVPLDLQFR